MRLAADMARRMDERLRLAILQLLAGQSDASANDAMLAEAVNALGFVCSRDKLRAAIFWLAQQGALHVLDLRGSNGFVIATLTEKGHDVAQGRSVLGGVAPMDREDD